MTTRAAQWRARAQQTVDITFPSGLSAELRPMDVGGLFRMGGDMPDYVTALLAEFMESGTSFTVSGFDRWKAFYGLCEQFARAMFVSPRIVDEPRDGEDEISIRDVPDSDLLWLFSELVGKPVEQMRSFRHEQGEHVDAVEPAKVDRHSGQ